MANAAKQKRFRERQRQLGNKQVRGYINAKAQTCYQEIQKVTKWTDSEILSNSLKITYAAYKCGQIKLLAAWLENNMSDDPLSDPTD